MDEMAGKLAFLERRLTLLEREVTTLKDLNKKLNLELAQSTPARLVFECDSPGLLASQAYPVENMSGARFCWMGSSGPVQIILPAAPVSRLAVKLFVRPHAKIDVSMLSLEVNNIYTPYQKFLSGGGQTVIGFEMAPSSAPRIRIVFNGVKSICPRDIGESQDQRLLAFCFYRAELEYKDESVDA